jgi:hypothetical protein
VTFPRRLEELRAEARYHRERRDLYRARAYSSRATSLFRLKELEQACVFADARLRRALQEQDAERRNESQARGSSILTRGRPGAAA